MKNTPPSEAPERPEPAVQPDNHIRLSLPADKASLRQLRIGDKVLLTGRILGARDAAHKRMIETLKRGEPLPADVRDQIIYYVGPSPAKPGQVIGSAGPTTAGRMDPYTPTLLALGLSGVIAKGGRSPEVLRSFQAHGAVYFAAMGGAGALLSKTIKNYKVLAYHDLGPEALAELWVEDFPVIVVADTHGGDLYAEGPRSYQQD